MPGGRLEARWTQRADAAGRGRSATQHGRDLPGIRPAHTRQREAAPAQRELERPAQPAARHFPDAVEPYLIHVRLGPATRIRVDQQKALSGEDERRAIDEHGHPSGHQLLPPVTDDTRRDVLDALVGREGGFQHGRGLGEELRALTVGALHPPAIELGKDAIEIDREVGWEQSRELSTSLIQLQRW